MLVRQAGGQRRGAPGDGPAQVQERDVAVEGEGVEVRMDEDLLDLYPLLSRIRTLLISVSCRETRPDQNLATD